MEYELQPVFFIENQTLHDRMSSSSTENIHTDGRSGNMKNNCLGVILIPIPNPNPNRYKNIYYCSSLGLLRQFGVQQSATRGSKIEREQINASLIHHKQYKTVCLCDGVNFLVTKMDIFEGVRNTVPIVGVYTSAFVNNSLFDDRIRQ